MNFLLVNLNYMAIYVVLAGGLGASFLYANKYSSFSEEDDTECIGF